ncbi:zinc finger protein [Teratosphaeria destructans]|uniref:Zinc finger protein n=1 Tax=Teratosphaeria destructans TaxID=418781 RepID=A0A9W7SZV8_9PEZI|nr:zinc finger protein [Teratosphaeria destructans]
MASQHQQQAYSYHSQHTNQPSPPVSLDAPHAQAVFNSQAQYSPISASPSHDNACNFSFSPSAWHVPAQVSTFQLQGMQTAQSAQVDISEINNLVAARGHRDAAPWTAIANHCPSLSLPINSFSGASATSTGSIERGDSTLDSAYQSQHGSNSGSLATFGSPISYNLPTGSGPWGGSQAQYDPPESVASDPMSGGVRVRVPKVGRRGRSRPRGEQIPCPFLPGCPKMLRNRSELEKHRLQHDRPYRCDFASCTRTEGFATPNDLDRHRISVHGARARIGRATGHVCQACPPPAPGTRPKFWPRRDNFKAHIKRRHGNCNVDHLVRISEIERPDDAMTEITESGYASQGYCEELYNGLDSASALRPDYIGDPSQQGDFSLFSTGGGVDELAGVGGQIADEGSGRHAQRCSGFHGPSTIFPNASSVPRAMASELKVAPMIASSIKSPRAPTVLSIGAPFEESHQFCPSTTARTQQCPIQEPGYSEIESTGRNEDVGSRTSNGQFLVCPEPGCGKIKKRECDLKKHRKRHTRPYGCTFPLCYKRFGSRNDWKRHENSQHFLGEQWRCEVNNERGFKCGRLFDREHLLISHLKDMHPLLVLQLQASPIELGETILQEAASGMHLGREANFRFWCGFCEKLVPQESRNAPEYRFKHLGDHFDRGDDISDWVCIQFNKQQRFITKEDKEEARRREQLAVLGEENSEASAMPLHMLSCIESILPPLPFDGGKSAFAEMTQRSYKRRRVDYAENDAGALSDYAR